MTWHKSPPLGERCICGYLNQEGSTRHPALTRWECIRCGHVIGMFGQTKPLNVGYYCPHVYTRAGEMRLGENENAKHKR